MTYPFYRAFENKFRGSRELIKSRLQIYTPFIQPLKMFYPDARALDLGCGRGEWLELVSELGFIAEGVDIDESMLDACKLAGFKINQDIHVTDAVFFLRNLPDESQTIISAFHVAEHILFEDLQTLVEESLRVLRPGGLLLLETPNPENLEVATVSFYLDPTHIHPIPPDLLAFIPDYYGFKKVKTIRLQESKTLIEKPDLSVFEAFNGVSPDYAVIAQKDGPYDLMNLTNKAFELDYGLTQQQLATKYHQQIQTKELSIQAKLQQFQFNSEAANAKLQQFQLNSEDTNAKLQQLQLNSEDTNAKLQQFQLNSEATNADIQGLIQELHKVYASKSWKVTQPLRKLKAVIKKPLSSAARWQRTKLRKLRATVKEPLSSAARWLRTKLRKLRATVKKPQSTTLTTLKSAETIQQTAAASPNLSAREAYIYAQLKKAQDARRRVCEL